MARGGKRPGAGRPPGTKSKRNRKTSAAVATEAATQYLLKTGHAPFTGDAHALLIWAYKNPELPANIRLDAAKAAIGYERPRLATSTVTVRRPSDMTDEELAAAASDAEAAAGAFAGVRGSLPPGTGPTTH